MIEFLLVYMSLLYGLIVATVVLAMSATALIYTYKLVKLVLNEKWALIVTIFIAVIIYAFILSLGIYFGEEPI